MAGISGAGRGFADSHGLPCILDRPAREGLRGGHRCLYRSTGRHPLGATNPRIKVQVKRRIDSAVNVEGLRAFMSVLGDDDVGIFVSAGGFTRDSEDEARMQERRKITLIDLEKFFDLWVKYYGQLPIKRGCAPTLSAEADLFLGA